MTAAARTTSTGASTRPVATATRASPSTRVWAGNSDRARPSWPPWATSRQPSLSSRGVGGDHPDRGVAEERREQVRGPWSALAEPSRVDVAERRSPPRARSPRGRRGGPSRCRARPPGRDRDPRHLPTVAPVPAPTAPTGHGPEVAVDAGAVAATAGPAAPTRHRPRGRTARARGRSGPVRPGSGSRCPCSSHHRITPSAAASPNAEPPVSRTASTRSTSRPGTERVELAGGRRAAAHLGRAGRALGEEHHRAAGAGDVVGPVADADAVHVGDQSGTSSGRPPDSDGGQRRVVGAARARSSRSAASTCAARRSPAGPRRGRPAPRGAGAPGRRRSRRAPPSWNSSGDELRVAQGAGQERHQAGGHRLDHRDAEELVHRGARHDRRPHEQLEVALPVEVADVDEPVDEPLLGLDELARVAPHVGAGQREPEVHAVVVEPPQRPEEDLRRLVVVPPVVPQHERRSAVVARAVRRDERLHVDTDRQHRRAGVDRRDQVGVAVVRRALRAARAAPRRACAGGSPSSRRCGRPPPSTTSCGRRSRRRAARR